MHERIGMQVRIRPGVRNHTLAFARFHRVSCDKPFDDGGADTGMTPEEMLLCALGSSAMHRVADYLRSCGLAPDGIELRVSAEPGASGLGEITIDLDAPGLTPRKREAILKAIDSSLLYQTLVSPRPVRLASAGPSQ
jgi:putative redox protein